MTESIKVHVDTSPPSGGLRYLVSYLAVVALFLGGAYWVTDRLVYFRTQPFDFDKLPDNAVIVTTGLTRKQAASIKLGFIENFDPPRVGMYGNHMFQYLSEDVFQSPEPRYFFNYWYGNLALPELRDLVAFVAAIGKLPTDTIILQITTPNNDNGLNILGYRGELLPDISRYGRVISLDDGIGKFEQFLDSWFAGMYYSLSYSSVISSILSADTDNIRSRIVTPDECVVVRKSLRKRSPDLPGILNLLPANVKRVLSRASRELAEEATRYCERNLLRMSLRRDGSRDPQFVDTPLRLNENALTNQDRDVNERWLKFGDEDLIASYMREIARIANGNGRKVVFVIPPVYETTRNSPANDIFSAALLLVPELIVIDHRKQGNNREFFVIYDHPSPKYFEMMVSQMRDLDLLP